MDTNKPFRSPPRRYQPRGLDILYEDRDLLVVNKEAGLLTMSPHRDETKTAEHLLTHYLRKGCARASQRAFVVHRLDRETSGVLMFAKSAAVQQRLKDNWKSTGKLYLAAVHGHLPKKTGVMSSYLAEDEDQFVYSTAHADEGRLAKTEYWVLKETPMLSLLKVRLLTGRKNQIRVHFAECGHPVAGDPKYGRKDRFGERLALHAKTLSFHHPYRGERMTFDVGIPEYFKRLAGGLDEKDWAHVGAIA